jgi:hypothetical protein
MGITKARKAITLLEVLIAIFIMGIGMLSVLALFPVAAFMMGQAIENYKVNDAIVNVENGSDSYLRDLINSNPALLIDNTSGSLISTSSTFYTTCNTPYSNIFYPLYNPKYLFLDQYANIGGRGVIGNIRTCMINYGSSSVIYNHPLLARPIGKLGSVEALTDPKVLAGRFFTLNTDIELDDAGASGVGGGVTRTGAYTISYLWENTTPLYSALPTRRHMLVHKNRSELYPDFNSEFVVRPSYPATAPNLISVNGSLDYKKGNWIMAQYIYANRADPTFLTTLPTDNIMAMQILKVSFHKIIAINERADTNGTFVELEVAPKMNQVYIPSYQPSHSSASVLSEYRSTPLGVPAPVPVDSRGVTSIGVNKVYLLTDVVRVVDLGN